MRFSLLLLSFVIVVICLVDGKKTKKKDGVHKSLSHSHSHSNNNAFRIAKKEGLPAKRSKDKKEADKKVADKEVKKDGLHKSLSHSHSHSNNNAFRNAKKEGLPAKRSKDKKEADKKVADMKKDIEESVPVKPPSQGSPKSDSESESSKPSQAVECGKKTKKDGVYKSLSHSHSHSNNNAFRIAKKKGLPVKRSKDKKEAVKEVADKEVADKEEADKEVGDMKKDIEESVPVKPLCQGSQESDSESESSEPSQAVDEVEEELN